MGSSSFSVGELVPMRHIEQQLSATVSSAPGGSRPGVRCQKAEVDVRVKRSILAENDENAETPRDLDPAFRRRLTRVAGGATAVDEAVYVGFLGYAGRRRLRTLPPQIYEEPVLSLASVPVLIFFLAFQRHLAKGLTGDATK